ncbi:MAG TPA: ribbon-helix-helix domain-containing protein [Pirellulales bacterium]|nr:ribbon-helix-helix domain-containing protein [Pirellulales bacterium]
MATPKKMKEKPITVMNAGELARITAEFDKEFVANSFHSPDAAAAAKWRDAKRKRGRPIRGNGAKVISVSLEEGLLSRANTLAKKLGIPRAKLISRGLEAVLAAEAERRT